MQNAERINAIWKNSEQQGSALLVLLALAWYADDTGRAWPRVASLARRTRLSIRHLRRILRRLEAARELVVEPMPDDRRRHAYRLVVQPAAPAGGAPRRKALPPPPGPLAATGFREEPPSFRQAERLRRLAAALPEELPGAAAWRRRILALSGSPGEVEDHLVAFDAELLRDAEAALDPEDARRLRRQVADAVDGLLRSTTVRLPASEAPRQRHRFHTEKLREHWGLPELSLFSPAAEGLAAARPPPP